MYKVIDLDNFKKRKQYIWFKTFSNPCYGLNVKMDVTEVVKYSKETKTSFFINVLYLITTGLNSIEEMRLREVEGEIRLYDTINPTFTVMTKSGVYENAGFEMINDYQIFYLTAKQVIDNIKNQDTVKDSYNDSLLYNDYYMTCLPWISIEGMTHPLCDNFYESSSCPRVCWDKYIENNGRFFMILNITVSHCFVDGYPLSCAFKNIQDNFNNCVNIFKK